MIPAGPDGRGRPRVLVVLPDLPVTPRSGAELRHRSLVRALGRSADVHVHALCHRAAVEGPPWPGVVGWTTSSDPALTPARLSNPSSDWLRRPDGHPTDAWYDESAADDLVSTAASSGADVVVLGGFGLQAYAPAARATGALVVLDHQNVEADAAAEVAQLPAPPPQVLVRRLLAERTAAREAELVASVDRVWAVSERDAGRLAERYPDAAPIAVVPNVVDELPAGVVAPSERGSPLVLYAGAYHYAPNADAATWFGRQVWPAVHDALPAATLVLAGAHPTPEVRALAGPAVEVTGTVDDLDPWFRRATLLPVPLRAGGGTRLKILQAFAHRVPVVTTAKGCEGLDVEPGTHLLVAETEEEWRRSVVEAHWYGARSDELTGAGRALVEQHYSSHTLEAAVAACLPKAPGGGT